MTAVLFVGAAAAASVLRWGFAHTRPLAILVINVVGSFLLGLLSGVGDSTMTVVGVGGLGAFTTYSTFAFDAVALGPRRAVSYVVVSVTVGIAAAWIGLRLA